MNTALTAALTAATPPCLYRSEAFFEDLADACHNEGARDRAAPRASVSHSLLPLLLPLLLAVLGAAVSASQGLRAEAVPQARVALVDAADAIERSERDGALELIAYGRYSPH